MKTLILFSGGIDSTVLLLQALEEGKEPICLAFDYQQRHIIELAAAKEIATRYKVPLIPLSFPRLPTTTDYFPGRNTIFLSLAASLAEQELAEEIQIGANQADQEHFPDTRPEYLEAVQKLLHLSSARAAAAGRGPTLLSPLLHLDKHEIVLLGKRLGVPFGMTHSCYTSSDRVHCGECSACVLRKEGFRDAKVEDPTNYANLVG